MENYWATKTAEERKAIVAKSVATRRANAAARKTQDYQVKQRALELKHNIKELKETLANLRREACFSTASVGLTTNALMTEEEIVKHAMPVDSYAGIYFLIKEEKVIYVGQSVNVFARIGAHNDKDFDSYVYLRCEKEMLNKLESFYIYFLKPPCNGTDYHGNKVAPLKLVELLA